MARLLNPRARRVLCGAALIAMGLVARTPARAEPESCPASAQESVRVSRVGERLELTLADGRVLRLVGVDPAGATPSDPDGEATARRQLTTIIGATPLLIRPLADSPDRWGRIPVLAFLAGQPPDPAGLSALVVGQGLGRYRAEPAAHSCRAVLLSAEHRARVAKLGLWADPYYAVLAVGSRADFAERSSTVVVAEGRLRAVETSVYRTRLRFEAAGIRRSDTLYAAIAPRVLKRFEASGMNVKALIGRKLEIRGLLARRFGPHIDLLGPDDVEADPPAAPAVP